MTDSAWLMMTAVWLLVALQATRYFWRVLRASFRKDRPPPQ